MLAGFVSLQLTLQITLHLFQVPVLLLEQSMGGLEVKFLREAEMKQVGLVGTLLQLLSLSALLLILIFLGRRDLSIILLLHSLLVLLSIIVDSRRNLVSVLLHASLPLSLLRLTFLQCRHLLAVV